VNPPDIEIKIDDLTRPEIAGLPAIAAAARTSSDPLEWSGKNGR